MVPLNEIVGGVVELLLVTPGRYATFAPEAKLTVASTQMKIFLNVDFIRFIGINHRFKLNASVQDIAGFACIEPCDALTSTTNQLYVSLISNQGYAAEGMYFKSVV